ncbi:MAG: Peptidase M29, aminopeptidase II [Candidatus Woesebacteria bacterium GW2011_GWD1_38_10]|uniref:Peptidase M29, aminopeptidase II n=1 Tax=Candidatus Woesebacteria bacterium GW2011_GWD1_38_10 TaxID=1618592 RepID=A0A0G0L6J3_9BACT|nr:MAG: Peptidase M29, aminopeptidase II [Candidatus Woesebacteria bacterium GW2011_GWD1_38_10]
MDLRIQKQADILVNHSLKVKKGERVVVISDFEAQTLALEVYRLLIKNGAYEVRVKFDSYEFAKAYFENASQEQIKYFPKIEEFETKNVDCYLRISAPTNTRALSGIDAQKISERASVTRTISDHRVEKTRWVITQYPTEAQAQEADMSLADYEEFVFSAINNVDWKKMWKDQENLRRLMDRTDKVRIVGENSDLTLHIKGRRAENCAGEFNMPDGEVFTSVVEDSANGFITYSFPAIFMGREFHNVRLEFKNGKVIEALADKNEEDLNKILDMDRGARFIGELGIGNNYAIKRYTKNILFDEKIGGTVHIALGKGYKKTLSRNVSALHWDMIKDLRNDGELWFDKKLVQKNGVWKIT